METQTGKLTETALWGAHLARSAAGIQSETAPVAFDVDVADVRVLSPPTKSPVQERWESWGPKGSSVTELEEKHAAAQRRKEVRAALWQTRVRST
jgi:hypothetical protein